MTSNNNTNNDSTTYSVNKPKKNEWGEYVVVVKENGVRNEDLTYYTDDREDALGTMQALKDSLGC